MEQKGTLITGFIIVIIALLLLVVTSSYEIILSFLMAKSYENSGHSYNIDPDNIRFAAAAQNMSLILIFFGIGLISAYFYKTEKKLSSGYSKYFKRSTILILLGSVIAAICIIIVYQVLSKPVVISYEEGERVLTDLVNRYRLMGILATLSMIGHILIYLGIGLFIFGYIKLKYLATRHGKQTLKHGESSQESYKFVKGTFNEKVEEESIEIEREEDAEGEEIEYAEVILD